MHKIFHHDNCFVFGKILTCIGVSSDLTFFGFWILVYWICFLFEVTKNFLFKSATTYPWWHYMLFVVHRMFVIPKTAKNGITCSKNNEWIYKINKPKNNNNNLSEIVTKTSITIECSLCVISYHLLFLIRYLVLFAIRYLVLFAIRYLVLFAIHYLVLQAQSIWITNSEW